MILNIVPEQPLVLLKGLGEIWTYPEARFKGRHAWYGIGSGLLKSVEDEGRRWSEFLAVMSESWLGSYKLNHNGVCPLLILFSPISPLLSSINWSKPPIALNNVICSSMQKYGAISSLACPQQDDQEFLLSQHFWELCVCFWDTLVFVLKFWLSASLQWLGFWSHLLITLQKLFYLFWCRGHTLGRTFTLSILELTDPQILHLTFCWITTRATESRDFVVVVQSLSHVQLFVTPWTAAHQASLSFTVSQSLLKLMSIESVMPYNHLILCYPLLLLPSIFPSIRVFSIELALSIRWPKYWSFSMGPCNEYSELISF